MRNSSSLANGVVLSGRAILRGSGTTIPANTDWMFLTVSVFPASLRDEAQ